MTPANCKRSCSATGFGQSPGLEVCPLLNSQSWNSTYLTKSFSIRPAHLPSTPTLVDFQLSSSTFRKSVPQSLLPQSHSCPVLGQSWCHQSPQHGGADGSLAVVWGAETEDRQQGSPRLPLLRAGGRKQTATSSQPNT